MVYTYSETALKIAIAQLAQNVGWNGIGSNSFEILIDLCARFVKELGKTSTCIANQFNRTQVNFDDLQLAFDYLGISLNELEDYYKHVDALPFAKGDLAKYPISTKGVKRINYPDLNEIRARAEFYEEWMPSIKLDSEKDKILNSKNSNDNDLNDENLLLNGADLNEEEMDLRYLNSLKSLVSSEEKIGGFTELSALVPNYIYLSELGQVLSYGGKEGKLPESKLPPLTAEDIERLHEEEEKKKQEIQKEKEKVFQPLKLKINNKEKLKFKKYLKDPKLKKDYMSKELLKRAKKDKKLKPKMNLNKLSIKVSSLNSQNNLINKEKSPSPVENDSLSHKQDLIETAEKLGLSSEIDELKKLNKLKEKKMKEKKTKIMKEEDLEKQKRKRERMRKKQEELEKKQKLREERKLRREQKEKEKEEKRKAREKKKIERMKAKLEKSPRKPKTPKKGMNDSKDEIYDDTSNFSLNSSQTNSIKTNPNNSKDSNMNDYDEKEAAITLVSLSEDKKTGKKNKKQFSPNISLTSPIDSSEDDDFSFKMDNDDDSMSSSFSLNNSNLSNSNDAKIKNNSLKSENIQKPKSEELKNKLEEAKNKLEEPKNKLVETKNKLSDTKNKLEEFKNETKVQKQKIDKEKINKNENITNLNSNKPIVTPVFKSLAERKAMPPEITDKPNTQKKEKLKKRIYDRTREDDLFKPMITLPTIKKKEKKPKKVFKELIETSDSSSDDEKTKKDNSKKLKKEDSDQIENTSSKLTVKLPSRTSSPLPFLHSKSSSQFSPKIKSKKDKSLKKEEKKETFKENNKEIKEKDREKDKEKIKKDKIDISSDKIKIKKDDSNKELKKHDKVNKSINEELKNTDSKPKKKAKIIITPTKAARKEAQENSCVLVTQTVSTGGTGEQIWICPSCSKPDDGSPMVGCDNCDDWYHWSCVGLNSAPAEKDSWFCKLCISKQQQIELKFKKKRKGDKDSENDQSNKLTKIENNDVKVEIQKNSESIKKIKKDFIEENKIKSTVIDQELSQEWICPSCNLPDDGSPMIGCDKCDQWFHWICVGITVEPKDEETWYCSRCSKNSEALGHKHKKHKKV